MTQSQYYTHSRRGPVGAGGSIPGWRGQKV